MDREKKRKIIGVFLSLFIISGCLSSPVRSFFNIPVQQRISVGDPIKINLNFPSRVLSKISLYVEKEKYNIFQVNGKKISKVSLGFGQGSPVATQPGIANIQLRLFGLIPIKNMIVEVLPELKIVPGGHSIGVILHSQGVLVVGQSIVEDENGIRTNPAKDAGIQVGDAILSINGEKVNSDDQVSKIINAAGEQNKLLNLQVKHKSSFSYKTVKPVKCKETNRYRIGLYIRDSAAGVGTLSFYDPLTKKFGALGHVITDADTNQPIDVGEGKVVKSLVQGIEKGKKGQPGEKVGMFSDEKKIIGKIEKNTNFGIFGLATKDLINPPKKALPIALASQIVEGPAEILTVIEGDKIEKFTIEIQRIQKQLKPDTKGLIIKVTDSRLLARTGGIIQGMSGSPIIQNGKIIGAVTHVFVNDPTRGYGVLIEWMLKESGIMNDKIEKKVGLKEVIPPFLFGKKSNAKLSMLK